MRRVKLGSSRVPCAYPEAVIHTAIVESRRGEVIEIEAPTDMRNDVRAALEALREYIEVLGEELEGETYRVRVRRIV